MRRDQLPTTLAPGLTGHSRASPPRAPQPSGVGVLSANMVLRPNTLVAGSSYTFSLSAAYVWPERRRRLQEDDASDASSASISLRVNTPPLGGTFEVSPTEGKRHETVRVIYYRCRVATCALCTTNLKPLSVTAVWKAIFLATKISFAV